MLSFAQEGLPARVVFGPGRRREVPAEVERLGIERALVITTPSKRAMAEEIAVQLGERAGGVFDRVAMHVPIEIARTGRAEAARVGANGCIALGGGSAVGLAKSIVLEQGQPIIALPTTYSGSEMTAIQGLTEDGVKRTYRDARMQPRTVIYDPELTVTLPPTVAGPSGMNALAHCVEAFYAENASPLLSLVAEEGIRALAQSLPRVVDQPADQEASARALYGAWLGGLAPCRSRSGGRAGGRGTLSEPAAGHPRGRARPVGGRVPRPPPRCCPIALIRQDGSANNSLVWVGNCKYSQKVPHPRNDLFLVVEVDIVKSVSQ